MAAAAASSSSTTTDHQVDQFEVFISFRGADVRIKFLSHLFASLDRKNIRAFIDDDLDRGNDTNEALFGIIEESDLSIVMFSPNYPKSITCLERLEKIHECLKEREQIVVPVFYGVDPADVQQLKGNYATEVKIWKDALVEISNLSGFDSKKSLTEASLIDAIVDKVSTKLGVICPSSSDNIGIDSSVKHVESLLYIESINDVRVVGIWGVGGIGKTTIANKIYNRIRSEFDAHCFVQNVRETLSRTSRVEDFILDQIITVLLGDKHIKKDESCLVDDSIRERLQHIKVLIVLDDVDSCIQLKALLEDSGLCSPDTFCPGSRIIVTSRDKQVLENINMKSEIYEAKQLKNNEALQLFGRHAFGSNYPQRKYRKLSEKIVQCAHGVPLALVVLGSQLKHKTPWYWKDTLEKLNITSPLEIQKIMRISFDGLSRNEKSIFLDIACFFKGKSRDYVENVLKAFRFHATTEINFLIDKSFITVEHDWIAMHDLLEQMGQEIVLEGKQSQEQSRLWIIDDIRDALTDNKGTEHVEAISITLCQAITDYVPIDISPTAFNPLCNLRYLHIDYPVHCPEGLTLLPPSIQYLDWNSYPLTYLPLRLEKLVELHLKRSKLRELIWMKPLQNLKCINLADSNNLVEISDLVMAPNLKVLDLSNCENLLVINSSMEQLNKLTQLDLRGCIRLFYLPEIPCSIRTLELRGSGIRMMFQKFWLLPHLKELILDSCHSLEGLPNGICYLKSLENFNLSRCKNLKQLPENLGKLTSLEVLDASYSGLKKLPLSIQRLKKLIVLNIVGCEGLDSLPDLPSNLEVLHAQNCTSLQTMRLRFTFPRHSLDLDGCPLLDEMASSVTQQYLSEATARLTEMPNLCIAGDRVPKWMTYSNYSGASLSLELDAGGHSISFIFCAVMPSSASFRNSPLRYAFPTAILTHESGQTQYCFNCNYSSEMVSLEEAPHVFLWNQKIHHKYIKEVSFERWHDSSDDRIMSCAVHPIFLGKNIFDHVDDEDD